MNDKCQSRLAEASKMLAEAKSLNASGQHGASMKMAYEASEYVASGYMAGISGQSLVPNDANYDLFAKAIRDSDRHPALLERIREVVSCVSVLREAYEPALLEETTSEDAQQMIGCVASLQKMVVGLVQ